MVIAEEIKLSNDFRKFNIGGHEFLAVESQRLSECIEYFRTNNFYGLSVNRYHGYSDDNLDFLSEVKGLKGLVVGEDIEDLELVNTLESLEYLTIDKSKKAIDFKKLSSLRTFKGKWSAKLASIAESTSIENLSLWSFKSKSKDLADLSELNQLTHLSLVSSGIEKLDGLEKLTNLTSLSLHYLSKLSDISSISKLSDNLNVIEFENCKKVESYEPLSGCLSLKSISIEKSASINSLGFATGLEGLTSIYWVGTKLNCEPSPVIDSLTVEKVIGTNGRFIKGSN